MVLVAPEIHWNTGNIGRTCLGTGSILHLIRPLGFSLDSKAVKRAGLDYWPRVKPHIWNDFNEFKASLAPADDEVVLFTKNGARPFWDMPRRPRLFLVFGSETKGLAPDIMSMYADNTCHIPITAAIRSLNLSTAAGIAVYESLRHIGPTHAWKPTPEHS